MNNVQTKSLPLIETERGAHSPGMGTLTVTIEKQCIALPLKKLAIQASVADFVSEVTMRQTFQNPYAEQLEAVYIFPLAGSAAIHRFDLKVGARTIRGIVKEREEARRDYERALDQGKRTGLLEKERDDVFTIKVGNLPPGEEIEVMLTYSESLPFQDNGATELRLPLVVAPRYIPGDPLTRGEVGDGVENDTDVVPDGSRITPPRLAGLNPVISLSISVDILNLPSAGVADFCCSQHAVRTQSENGICHLSLSQEDELLDRDFVLRWRVVSERIQSSLLMHQEEDGGSIGMLSIVPPRQEVPQAPRDVVFLLDRSGSMEGVKMVSAARACIALLASLNPGDRFCILAFDNEVEWFPGERGFVAADEAGRERGQRYLHSIRARGGTEMFNAFTCALQAVQARADSEKRVSHFVLITDGQVGDESRMLQRMQSELRGTRVFTVGVDTAVNQAFLQRLAALGGGTSSFVEPGVQVEEALQHIARDIGTPVVTDLKMEEIGCGLDRDSITPERLPDLFSGRPVIVFFRLKTVGKIRINGVCPDGSVFQQLVEAHSVPLNALPKLWARSRVMDLEDRFRIDRDRQSEWKQKIIELALKYSLLTRFTAFVVIDETEIVNADGSRRKVVQPVHMPARWEMDADMAHQAPASGAFLCMQASPPPVLRSASAPAEWWESATDKLGSLIQERKRKKNERRKSRGLMKELDAFTDVIQQFTAEIDAGIIPSSEKLERARTKLMQALLAANLDLELARLVEFLRREARELVRALSNPSISPAMLKPIFEKNGKLFQEVRQESLKKLGAPADRFWEKSI
ncbi:VIT and VWA domain-containing protein [bacterium]|nr:VIT and VWA domain-containing protein [bacterium]MCI0601658.1 VIT and VWA domain-containing protein [bacterium]